MSRQRNLGHEADMVEAATKIKRVQIVCLHDGNYVQEIPQSYSQSVLIFRLLAMYKSSGKS